MEVSFLSLIKNNPVIHYRFKRKINDLNCFLQLYIVDNKIKIIINCCETYSHEYKEYLNYFSINDLQKKSKYFNYFNNIQDLFEDFANILKENRYIIEKDSDSLLLILQLSINSAQRNVILPLNRTHNTQVINNTKASQILKNIKNDEEHNHKKRLIQKSVESLERSQRNVGVCSVNELNNLLTDLKDRLTVLEVTQNTSQIPHFYNNEGMIKEQDR